MHVMILAKNEKRKGHDIYIKLTVYALYLYMYNNLKSRLALLALCVLVSSYEYKQRISGNSFHSTVK
jgi:hypothetical protein